MFSFAPSRTAAQCVAYVIQQKYKNAWKRFREVPSTEKEAWFKLFKV